MLRLRLDQVRPNPWNCNFLSPQEKASLKQRMKEDGPEKTQPVVVRKTTKEYELVDGEQRWELACELGWEFICAIEREADDLQTKALCVGYNRWRGRLNWFKLYDVMKKDLEAGVNIYEAYDEALSSKEIESVLSLGKLVPEARGVLEESVKRHPEITLEHLHLLSLFPASQQVSLVNKFKSPVVAQALLQALNPFLPKNQPQPSGQEPAQQSPEASQRSLTAGKPLPERAARSTFPMRSFPQMSESSKEKEPLPNQQQAFSRSSKLPDEPEAQDQAATQITDARLVEGPEKKPEVQKALLIELAYDCQCGRHYRVSFKNMSVVVQKENELFEHVDLKPRTFQVHCDKCNSEHEFAVEGVEGETKQIFCRRCKPLPRRGILDVNTGGVTWLD
jgi:hypothetical protein